MDLTTARDVSRSVKVYWSKLPTLFQTMPEGGRRFWEFFTVNIRNPNTRRAYFKAVEGFAAWYEERGLGDIAGVTSLQSSSR